MKKTFTWPMWLAAGLLVLSPTFADAQLKVGVVDISKLRQQMPQAQAAMQTLEREFAPRMRELTAEQQEVQKLQDRLTREAEVLADQEEAMRLEREFRNRQRDLQRNATQYEEDLNLRRNEEYAKLQRLIFAEVQAYARDENFDLMLHEGVLYASENINVTDAVLKRLQSQAANRN